MIKKSFFALALLSMSSMALNDIHDARYQFFPYALSKNSLKLGGGGIWTMDNGLKRLPLRLSGNFTPDLEGGMRLNLDAKDGNWNKNNLSTNLDLGLSGKLKGLGQIQLDVLIPLGGNNSAQGANVSYTRFVGTRDLGMAAQGQLFFKFNDSELAQFELGCYPYYRMFPNLDLVGELTFSSSVTSPVDYAALDLAPGLRWRLGGGWTALGTATLGVKGAKSEGPVLWKTVLVHEFF